jgi:hypothetical protein
VTSTEAQRTAGHAGPFPGVGVGVAVPGGGWLCAAALPAAVVPPVAVVPPPARELGVLSSGRDVVPHAATDAASAAAAAAQNRLQRHLPYSRPRGAGAMLRMLPILRRTGPQQAGNPLRTGAPHERVIS